MLATGLTRWCVLKEVTENLRKPLVAIRKYCLKCLSLLLSTEDELDKLGVFSDLQKHLQTLQSTGLIDQKGVSARYMLPFV